MWSINDTVPANTSAQPVAMRILGIILPEHRTLESSKHFLVMIPQ